MFMTGVLCTVCGAQVYFKLLDLTALVSGKITSVYCQILEILG